MKPPTQYAITTITTALAMLAVPLGAWAQALLLHLPFDGNLGHNGRVGEPRFVVEGATAPPMFVPGYQGQGLRLDGAAAVAAPFNLDHAIYPQVTVTAWVRHEADASGVRTVFSSGSSAGIRMSIGNGSLTTRVGGRGVSHGTAEVRTGAWVFVAVVVDTAAGSARMFIDDEEPFERDGIDASTRPPTRYRDPNDPTADPQPWVFVGTTSTGSFGSTSRTLVIDELRVYAGALTDEQISALREPSAPSMAAQPATAGPQPSTAGRTNVPGPSTPVGATQSGSLARGAALPDTCNGNDDCPEGFYCAIERLCHPDRHAPLSSLQLATVEQPLYTLTPESDDAAPSRDGPVSGYATGRADGAALTERVSGEASDTTITLDFIDRFITGIEWEERTDRPCMLRLLSNPPNEDVEMIDTEVEGCSRNLDPTALLAPHRVEIFSPEDAPNDVVGLGVRRLAVCDNDRNNHRIKGLSIGGNLIQSYGSTQIPTARSQDELAHCREWRAVSACDQTRLATGVVVHYTQAMFGNEQIVGLQLLCRRAEFIR